MIQDPVSQQIQSHVTMDSTDGSIRFVDPFTQRSERLALLDGSFIRSLFEYLQSPESQDACGRTWGRHFHGILSGGIKNSKDGSVTAPEDLLKEEFTEMLNSKLSYSGLGQFRITEANVFYVIDLRNSFAATASADLRGGINRLLAGFFSGLFSELSKKSLTCISISARPTVDRNLFALCLSDRATEIRDLCDQGKDDMEILAAYSNKHIL